VWEFLYAPRRTIRILSISHFRRNARRLQFLYFWNGKISSLARNRDAKRPYKEFSVETQTIFTLNQFYINASNSRLMQKRA
jgi:hypothetical protein